MTQSSPRIGIVTPTYERDRLLKRFLKQIQRQKYQNWRLAVVHDGLSEKTQTLVEQFSASDQRITYLSAEERANDYGMTPRLSGANYLTNHESVDYLVFWDDDNSFGQDALLHIQAVLSEKNYPGLLLVPFFHENRLLPSQQVSLQHLHAGQVDTANLVVRAEAGVKCLSIAREIIHRDMEQVYVGDYLFFAELRNHLAPSEIQFGLGQPIGVHDGLRVFQSIRWALRIPKLELGQFQWYRNLKKKGYEWF